MKNIIIQNIFISFFSKGILFLTFIFLSRELSVDKYSVYVYVSLILNFLPFFQLGSSHGISILLPKLSLSNAKEKKEIFLSYSIISICLQFIVFIIFFLKVKLDNYILLVICVDFILSKLIENSQIYLNSHLIFQKANNIKFFEQVFKPVFIFLFFYFYRSLESVFYSKLFTTIMLLFLVFNKEVFKYLKYSLTTISFSKLFLNGQLIYKTGFFVFISWAFDLLFRSSDLWIVKHFYSNYDFAQYGFTSSLAMNLWLFAMSYFAPYSNLLYSYVAKGEYDNVRNIVKTTNRKIFVIIAILIIFSLSFYPFLINFFVKKYEDSYLLFGLMTISAFALTMNNMYIYYLVSTGKFKEILKIQSLIVLLNFLLLLCCAKLNLSTKYVCCSTILSLSLYYFIVRNRYYYFINNLNVGI